MKTILKTAVALLILVLLVSLLAAADCPTTAICPEDGMSGNPTGRYKWIGTIEYAQFTHITPDDKTHVWWERCT
jgi:hypothetical protein